MCVIVSSPVHNAFSILEVLERYGCMGVRNSSKSFRTENVLGGLRYRKALVSLPYRNVIVSVSAQKCNEKAAVRRCASES